ncbi:MAG: NAD(P)H-dependent oxidoreductase [Sphingomonas oligoaromativorans]|jgi:NAD(P)H dehydrogenase (quinone)
MTDRIRHVAIVAHPNPTSFNASVVQAYRETVLAAGQEVVIRDLYAMRFDPVLKDSERPGRPGFAVSEDVRSELELIRGADLYTIIHPIWFGMPPAILTGYVDRVIGAGVTAHEVQNRAGQGVLNGKRLFNITTSGAREVWLDEQGQIEALRNIMSLYLYHAFGMQRAECLHLGGVVEGYNPHFAAQSLDEVRDRTRRLCGVLADEQSRNIIQEEQIAVVSVSQER